MWVYLVAVALFVFGVLGTFVGGGFFTVVLIPLALIVAGAGFVYSTLGGAAQRGVGTDGEADRSSPRPLPHHHQRPSGRAPTTPEGLADSRRAQQ